MLPPSRDAGILPLEHIPSVDLLASPAMNEGPCVQGPGSRRENTGLSLCHVAAFVLRTTGGRKPVFQFASVLSPPRPPPFFFESKSSSCPSLFDLTLNTCGFTI